MTLTATTRIPAMLLTAMAGVLLFMGVLFMGVIVSTVSTGAAPAGAQQQPESESESESLVIDFEDYRANRVGTPAAAGITDFYQGSGLVFIQPVTALVYNDQSVPADPDFARSGSTVITTCYAAEFCSNNIEMELLSDHERVRLWVGYDGPIRSPANLLLIGFDRDRTVVARTAVTFGQTAVRLPVDIPMEISDPEGRIGLVQLAWADGSRFLSGLSVDDIELTPFVATSRAEFETDLVQLNADDGAAEQPLRLLNTGNVEVEVATVELEVEDQGDSAARFGLDGTGCVTILERGSSCEVIVAFDAEENGTRLARVIARDSAGAALAVATLEGTFTAAVTDTTADSGDETTDTTADGGDETTDTTAGNDETTDTTTVGSGGIEPEDLELSDPAAAAIAVLVVAVVLVGLTIAIRRIRRRTPRPPRPNQTRPDRPRPQPRPEIRVRPADGPHVVVGDGGPVVTIRAFIGPSETEVTETPIPEAQVTETPIPETRVPEGRTP